MRLRLHDYHHDEKADEHSQWGARTMMIRTRNQTREEEEEEEDDDDDDDDNEEVIKTEEDDEHHAEITGELSSPQWWEEKAK